MPKRRRVLKKVLVVDDDVDVTKFVSKLIERAGYEAMVAKNGIEGMGKVREDKPEEPDELIALMKKILG